MKKKCLKCKYWVKYYNSNKHYCSRRYCKYNLLLATILTIIICCSGCGNTTTNEFDSNYQGIVEDTHFLRIDSIDGCIYVDKKTKCQYLWIKRGYGGGITLLVNEDGTPKLYEQL